MRYSKRRYVRPRRSLRPPKIRSSRKSIVPKMKTSPKIMNPMAVTSKIAAWRVHQRMKSSILSIRQRKLVVKAQHKRNKRRNPLKDRKMIKRALCRRHSKQTNRKRNISIDLIQ